MVCNTMKPLYRFYLIITLLTGMILLAGCEKFFPPPEIGEPLLFPSETIVTFSNDSDLSIMVSGGDFGFSDSRVELRRPSQITELAPHESGTLWRFRNFNDELFSAEIVSEYIMLQGSGLDYTIAGWPESAYSWPQANLYGAGYLIGDDSSRDFEFDQGTSHYHVDMNLGDRESIIIRVYATIRIGADLSVTYTVDEVVGSSSVDEEGEPLPITLVE